MLITKNEIFSESEWNELVSDIPLSLRQADLVKHLLSGKSDKQIALEMQISVSGVRAHLNRLFLKFDLQERHELVLYMFCRFREKCRENGCPYFR